MMEGLRKRMYLLLKSKEEEGTVLCNTKHKTTFKIFNKAPEVPFESSNFKRDTEVNCKTPHLVTNLKQFKDNECTKVLQGTSFEGDVHPTTNNGFVSTVIKCYNQHHNLVLRPDDIWIAIMSQFSLYINANAEEFRNKFVSFDGKKELCVEIPGSLESASYDLFVQLITTEIDRNLVDKEVKDWILPSFTTTTEDDCVTSGVIFMATMKKYFQYTCGVCCGIPSVTLLGTVDDWKLLVTKLDKLKSYNLTPWFNLLEPICRQFVRVKQGKVDTSFWQRICHYQELGSGDPQISGWVTSFCVFNEDGDWLHCSNPDFRQFAFRETYMPIDHPLHESERSAGPTRIGFRTWPTLDIPKIPSGIVEVNVKILERGHEYQSILFAGHMAYEILSDRVTLQPRLGWAITLKPDK